jgi:hypothetical protein
MNTAKISSSTLLPVLALVWGLTAPLSPVLAADGSEPIAMTTDVQGKAWVVEGGKQTPLGLMAYLPRGARLQLDKGARVAVTYFAVPREYTLSGPTQAIVEAQSLRGEGAAAASRTLNPGQSAAGKQFSARQRDQLALATFEMKASGVLSALQPDDTLLISSPEHFTWQALSGISLYRFVLQDEQGQVLHKAETKTAELKLPANVRLLPGKAYRWSVEAVATEGAQTAQARFSMLDGKLARQLEQSKPGPGARFSDRIIYATMLDNAGARLAANAQWKALAQERPDDEKLQQLSQR